MIHNVTMKAVRDITLHLHLPLGMDPNPLTSQAEACTAKSNQQSQSRRGLFCRKATKSESLLLGFSFPVLVRLTILCEQLFANNHGGKQLSFINQPSLLIIIFLFLLYVVEVLSSLNNREKRTIRIEFLNLARQI